jgi:integrase
MKVGGRRNFGYGKRLWWAGKNALRDRYGDGCYGSRAAHEARWRHFAEYAKCRGVKDARDVTRELIVEYGEALSAKVGLGELSVRYAQNLLSTVNVVMETMRGDRCVRVTPAALVGKRRNVRSEAPEGLDRSVVDRAILALNDQGENRAALVAALARYFGLRFREACMLDSRRALRDAIERGEINVTAGTKGGRGKKVDRWVPVSDRAVETLKQAAHVQGADANLIPASQSYRQWREHAYHVWQRAASQQGLRGFHDLRAAYACERYSDITGCAAPVVGGHRSASKEDDAGARQMIAHELGHGRADVVAAYVGSAR